MEDAEFKRIHIAIIAGDAAAQLSFEAKVRPFALGIAMNRGLSIEDGQEIWNDAFRVALERAPTIEPPGRRLRAFALSVVHAASVDRVRLRQRRHELSLEGAEPELDAKAMHQGQLEPLSALVVAAIRRCLEAAGDVHREVMTMAANRLTAREIATALALTEANAAKLRQRARTWFANCLEGVVA